MKLELDNRSTIERRIVGAIRSSVAAHGTLDFDTAPSAAKRVYGELKALAREQRDKETLRSIGF